MHNFAKRARITDSVGVVFEQTLDDQMVIKVGEIDLADPIVTGCRFDDKDGINHYEFGDINRDILEFPEEVEGHLIVTNIEDQKSHIHRVRAPHHLREARQFDMVETADPSETMKTMAKVALGTFGVVIGVYTLKKIRSRRSHE